MKYMADTHMHSIYSYDGQMKLEDMVKKGVELGLKYMIFTEHLELNQIKYSQFLNRYNLYSEEIDILQEKYPKLKLLKGIEFSNPEMYLDELEKINELELDYLIGRFPNDERLKLYQNLGGKKVTLGSDAHRLNEIYDFIPAIDDNYNFNKGIYVKRKFISLSNN